MDESSQNKGKRRGKVSIFPTYLERIFETNFFLRKENPPFPPTGELLEGSRINYKEKAMVWFVFVNEEVNHLYQYRLICILILTATEHPTSRPRNPYPRILSNALVAGNKSQNHTYDNHLVFRCILVEGERIIICQCEKKIDQQGIKAFCSLPKFKGLGGIKHLGTRRNPLTWKNNQFWPSNVS